MKKGKLRKRSKQIKPKLKKKGINTLMREYGLPDNICKAGRRALRYRNPPEKGIAWYWFAQYVRLRDSTQWKVCISCGKPKSFEELNAGHFAPASDCGLDLLMDERNVNGECSHCNSWDSAHLWGYEKNLDIRYGKGTAEALKKRYEVRNKTITKINNWGEIALKYQELYNNLSIPIPS